MWVAMTRTHKRDHFVKEARDDENTRVIASQKRLAMMRTHGRDRFAKEARDDENTQERSPDSASRAQAARAINQGQAGAIRGLDYVVEIRARPE